MQGDLVTELGGVKGTNFSIFMFLEIEGFLRLLNTVSNRQNINIKKS